MNKKRLLITFILTSVLIITGIILINTNKLTPKLNDSIRVGDKIVSEETKNQISTFVTEDIRKSAENATFTINFNEEMTLKELVDSTENIAIVRIISLDSSNAQFDHIVGNTYGKLMIIYRISIAVSFCCFDFTFIVFFS